MNPIQIEFNSYAQYVSTTHRGYARISKGESMMVKYFISNGIHRQAVAEKFGIHVATTYYHVGVVAEVKSIVKANKYRRHKSVRPSARAITVNGRNYSRTWLKRNPKAASKILGGNV